MDKYLIRREGDLLLLVLGAEGYRLPGDAEPDEDQTQSRNMMVSDEGPSKVLRGKTWWENHDGLGTKTKLSQ